MVQVHFTVDDAPRGDTIAETLLNERLVACVQRVGPIRSRYWWQGQIEEAEEWLFLCKAPGRYVDEIASRIAELHPYDTPEVIATPVVGGLAGYVAWVDAEATGPL